ncbi:MAG: ribosome silencing factor [Elusimicrobiota bacterium]|nr:ribosome silencing factor [Elusimicrobiota bacterium]
MRPLKLARKIAKILQSKKCKNVIILNVRRLTTFTDYFVIATVLSNVQMKVAVDTVLTDLKQKGTYQIYRQSHSSISPEWQTLDYGNVVVHIMSESARSFYCLERLWYKARRERHTLYRTKEKVSKRKVSKIGFS